MDAFIAALVFVAVVIALVVLQLEERRRHARELGGERRRTDELLDRLMASNLAEYATFKTTEPEPAYAVVPERPGRWVHSADGLQTVWVPAGEDD